MSTISDDELQRIVEEGGSTSSGGKDFMAYQKLFSILGEQPEHQPTRIADAVVSRIEASRKRTAVRDYIWLALGIFVLIVIGFIAVVVSGYRIPLSGWQRTILALGTCAGLVIMLLNTLERKLLHR